MKSIYINIFSIALVFFLNLPLPAQNQSRKEAVSERDLLRPFVVEYSDQDLLKPGKPKPTSKTNSSRNNFFVKKIKANEYKILNKKVSEHDKQKIEYPLTIQNYYLYHLPIGQKEDIISYILNRLHRDTEPNFILRQLSFRENKIRGEREIVESEKNLRFMKMFTQIKILPVNIDQEKKSCDLLLLTRDSFSLYSSLDGGVSGGRRWFEYEIGDYNFLGLGYSTYLNFYRDAYQSLLRYYFENRRIANRNWNASLLGGIQLDESDSHSGNMIELTLQYPLLYAHSRWSFLFNLSHDNLLYHVTQGSGLALLPGTEIPLIYRRKQLQSETLLVYSFGFLRKLNFGLGAGISAREYEHQIDLNKEDYDIFSHLYKRKDDQYLILSFSTYHSDYRQTRNLNLFRLSEFLRRGFSMTFTERMGQGKDPDDKDAILFMQDSELAYNYFFTSSDILRLSWTSHSRISANNISQASLSNAKDVYNVMSLRYYLRRLIPGNIIFYTSLASLYESQYFTILRSGELFRGYLFNEFVSEKFLSMVGEYRSPSLSYWYFTFGFVLFYEQHYLDWNLNADRLRSVGAGVRLMFPDISYSLLRIDFAWPLDRNDNLADRILSFGFQQQI